MCDVFERVDNAVKNEFRQEKLYLSIFPLKTAS